MRLLVLTSEPISADELRAALGEVNPEQAEIMIVAPALQQDALRFWLSDADDAIAEARGVGKETLEQLGEDGISASADTGESDPMLAIQDALATFDADRIVLFTHPGSQRRYREDVDIGEIDERFGIPVDHAIVDGAG
jgi:hypothetical protein